jgi:[ribosomal protein S5]-alanine N-acetyltransferase
MVTGLTEWLFNMPEVTKVKAECLETNPASARVLQKSGFLKTAKRDGMIYWEKFCK